MGPYIFPEQIMRDRILELEQKIERLRGALIFVLNHPCIKYNKRFSYLRENMFSMVPEIAQQALEEII